MDYTREQRREASLNLDPELKDVLLSDETAAHVEEFVSRHAIRSDLVPFLSEEIANVLSGLRAPSEFIPALQRKLQLTPQAAQLLANDINTSIFRPVRIPLLKLFGLSDNNQSSPTKTQPQPTPAVAPIKIAPPIPKPTPVTATATPAPTQTQTPPPAPIQAPAPRIPVIVPPPGIGMTQQAPQTTTVQQAAPVKPVNQFVQYQPLKQNPFEMKPMPQPNTPAQQTQPTTAAPQVHTLKADIKNMTIVQQKLNNVVSAPKKTIEWTKPEIKINSSGSYTVDPYREPPQA